MLFNLLANAPIGLAPVIVFLAVLLYCDSYKLLRLRSVLGAILVGACAAGLSYLLNLVLIEALAIDFVYYVRYVSPLAEEALKAMVLIYLIRSRRIGLLVDAAIFGFAIGTGFGVVENLYYIATRPDAHIGVWVVRGFGTAIMHGGASAVFAIVSVELAEEKPDAIASVYLPGLAAAFVLHSAFNHFLVVPVLSTLGVLLLLPPLIYLVFQRSERALEEWIGADFDSDIELLEQINSGDFSATRAGQYLHTVGEKFKGPIMADMLCYLRLHAELALRAKGTLLMRESGIDLPMDEETREKFTELQFLERSIGRTGQLAMQPVLRMRRKDLWQLYMLGK